jgi:KUP system potassium uptake protein
MAQSAQAATALHGRPRAAGMTLTALGIVYGDIGTSPPYALKQAAGASGTLLPDALLGIASLIFWSLIVVVTRLKCAV